MRISHASGFIAQEKLMAYATPGIKHYEHSGFETWNEARQAADLMWEPEFVPLITDELHPSQVHDRVGMRRSDTKYLISTTSMKHRLIDHSLVGTVVEGVQDVHDIAHISGLVCQNLGRKIGVRITHGTQALPFDPSPISKETWIWLNHDATGALFVKENAQRMTCTNQLGFFGRGITTDLKVRHVGDVARKVADLVATIKEQADWAAWEKEMTKLHEDTLTDVAFEQITRRLFPLATVASKSAETRATKARSAITGLYEEYSLSLGANKYAAYQAVTEYEDQIRTARGEAGMFIRAIEPNPRKDVALRLLGVDA